MDFMQKVPTETQRQSGGTGALGDQRKVGDERKLTCLNDVPLNRLWLQSGNCCNQSTVKVVSVNQFSEVAASFAVCDCRR